MTASGAGFWGPSLSPVAGTVWVPLRWVVCGRGRGRRGGGPSRSAGGAILLALFPSGSYPHPLSRERSRRRKGVGRAAAVRNGKMRTPATGGGREISVPGTAKRERNRYRAGGRPA
ncbi:hypothetical protein GCM10009753_38310 [Streptantibioticus ferralitis]